MENNEKHDLSKQEDPNSFISPKKTFAEEPFGYSTPKSVNTSTDKKSNESCNTNIIKNPFETKESYLASLSRHTLSPSFFDPISEMNLKSPENFWNVEQLSLIQPANIDTSRVKDQQVTVELDSESHDKAQKAIDHFFKHQLHIPSPSPLSTSKRPKLPFMSPSPVVCKKKSAAEDLKEEDVKVSSFKSASVQTMLSIPVDVQLDRSLFEKYSYVEEDEEADKNESSSSLNSVNSSLRRRLFSPNCESDSNTVDVFYSSPSSKDFDEDIRMMSSNLVATPSKFQKSSVKCLFEDLGTPIGKEKKNQENEINENDFKSPGSDKLSSSNSNYSNMPNMVSPGFSPIVENHRKV